MTYTQALATARRIGASRVQGDGHLAQTCYVLSLVHAINPALVYDGARSRGITADVLRKMAPADIGDLMFTLEESRP